MYIPRNWKFGSSLAKLQTFFGGGGLNIISMISITLLVQFIVLPMTVNFSYKILAPVTFLHLFGYGCIKCIKMELEILDGHHLIQENKSIYKAPGGYVYNYSGFLPKLMNV
jgi:hypothetical protein